MKKIIVWSFLLSLFGCGNTSSQEKSEKISLEKIEEMFSNMKSNGVNTDATMLWGYFFTSSNKDAFEKVANELKAQSFEFVEIHQAEDKSYWLHLERKEIHTAKSLYELDEELYKVAEKYRITYDGFDVGNVNKNKGIERDTYVVPEEFQTFDYQKDNLPCLLIGNTAFKNFQHKEEFKYFIKITTSYKNDGKVMLPTNEELNKLNKFEYLIEDNLTQNKIKNYYVFRETYKGIRVFYIVTNDNVSATNTIKSIKNSSNQRTFEFEIITDKDWSLYNNFLEKITQK